MRDNRLNDVGVFVEGYETIKLCDTKEFRVILNIIEYQGKWTCGVDYHISYKGVICGFGHAPFISDLNSAWWANSSSELIKRKANSAIAFLNENLKSYPNVVGKYTNLINNAAAKESGIMASKIIKTSSETVEVLSLF